jgi:hypothetical protein
VTVEALAGNRVGEVAAQGGAAPVRATIPPLDFAVLDAASVDFAAVPTLSFTLQITTAPDQPIRSILLFTQLQIAARQRAYSEAVQPRLLELFGTPERWAATLRTLPWVTATLVVPPFLGQTTIELAIPCTYDLEVTAARYFAALDEGEVPLEFLFSGSLFFETEAGALQTTRIAWDREAAFRLPVSVWKAAMARHFPDSAWLRLGSASFDRLCTYKARHAFPSFDAALDALLAGEGAP